MKKIISIIAVVTIAIVAVYFHDKKAIENYKQECIGAVHGFVDAKIYSDIANGMYEIDLEFFPNSIETTESLVEASNKYAEMGIKLDKARDVCNSLPNTIIFFKKDAIDISREYSKKLFNAQFGIDD